MADINDLAQQIAYYQAGGSPPGRSPGELFNQGASDVLALGKGVEDIIKQRLEAKKLELGQTPTYKFDQSLPQNPADVQAQQKASDLAQASWKQAMSSFPQQQQDTAGTATQPQQPTAYQNPYTAWQEKTGLNPLMTVEQNKEYAQAKALAEPGASFFVDLTGTKTSPWPLDNTWRYGGRIPEKTLFNGMIGLQKTNAAEAGKNARSGANKTIGDVFPGWDQMQIEKQLGPGFTKDSNFYAASKIMGLNQKKETSNKMFPIASLSPDAQEAAIRGGFGAFVPESAARILNAGNLPKPASPEQIKDWASVQTMQDEIRQIKDLAQKTNYKGVGPLAYATNRLGQYIPIDELATDPQITEMYRLINDVNNKMIYYQSGKQINEQEFARLKSTFPDPGTNVPTFQTRLMGFENAFNQLSGNIEKGLQASGIRHPGATTQPPPDQKALDAKRAAVRAKLQL